MNDTDQKEAEFLEAWKEAIKASKHQNLFYGDPAKETRKSSLAPKLPDIRRSMPNLPSSTAAWLSILVQLYSPPEGARLADRSGLQGFGAQLIHLDEKRREILSRLTTNFTGF